MTRALAFALLLLLIGCNSPTVPTGPSSASAPAALPPNESTPSNPTATADTWIISGQSNAVGCAGGIGPSKSGRVLMPLVGSWVPASDPLSFVEPCSGCEVGAWVTAAQVYNAAAGRAIKLTGWARVSSAISLWRADQDGWSRLRARIRSDGQAATTFLWWQGEAEAASNQATGYAAALADLVRRVRDEAHNPSMRVVVIALADAPYPDLRKGYERLRNEQRTFVANDGRALIVSAEGLPLNPDKPYHLTVSGYAELGRRVAAAMR